MAMPKLCTECAFLRKAAYCAAGGSKRNLVYGGLRYYASADSMRSDSRLCGPEAKLFQPYKTWWLGIGKNPNEHPNEVG